MDIEAVITHFGSLQATADALGLRTHASVSHWRRLKRIPAVRQYQIQRVTKGLFKATCKPWEHVPRAVEASSHAESD